MKTKIHVPPPPEAQSLEQANEVIRFLWNKLIELEDRIHTHSGNSSSPPSADGPGTLPDKRRKASSGKPRGAQPGHKGHRRVAHPHDHYLCVQPHFPASTCGCCGGSLVNHSQPYRIHQVFDLPQFSYEITEHQLFQGTCSRCGEAVRAPLPTSVSQTQMGANLLAYIALQSGQFHQSISQIQLQLKQVVGLCFSRGAISEAQGRVSAMLTPTHQAIKQQVQQAPVIHADETRHQRGNEHRWMWLALSPVAACFMTAFSRGQDAARRLLGLEPPGVLVTDQYSGYRFVDPSKRQLCWAHVARNVAAIADSADLDNQPIGERLVLLAAAVFRTQHRYDEGHFSEQHYLRRLIRLRQSWRRQLAQGSYRCSKRYRGRCQLLLKDDEMLWRFMDSRKIPLTNNEAERALRGYVLWRKGSYGVWSHRGEQFRQRILSLVETAKRLKRCPQEWIRAVIKACIEKTDYPIPVELRVSTAYR